MLFVSHNMGRMQQLCRYGVLLENGRYRLNLWVNFCYRLLFQASEFYPYRNSQFYGMIKKYVIIAEKVVYDKNMRIT